MKLQVALILSAFLSEASSFVQRVPHSTKRAAPAFLVSPQQQQQLRSTLLRAVEEKEATSVAGVSTQDETTAPTTTSSSSSSSTSADAVLRNQPVTVGQEELSIAENESALSEMTEQSEAKKLMQKVKDAGTAGIISYALWELGFWFLSVPVVVLGYREVTGHFPDLSNKDDVAKLGAEAFAFVNFARFAVPLRIGLALSTTPWIQNNIVDRFFAKKDEDGGTETENSN